MTKFEKETYICYSKGDKKATISSFDTGLNRRFIKYANEYPDFASVIETNEDYLRGEIMKDRLSVLFKSPKQYSPEEKQKMLSKIGKHK